MSYPLAIAAPQVGALSETFIRRHMEELKPNETAILTNDISSPYAAYWNVEGPIFLCKRWPQKNSTSMRVRQRIEKKSLIKFLKKNKVQKILGEFLDYSYDFFLLAKDFNIPYYAHAHGCDVSVSLRNPAWQRKYLKYNNAAGIITMSHISRQKLIGLGIDSKKIITIPYGVNVPDLPIQRKKNKQIRCLAVGRMVAKKAPIFLLESFRQSLQKFPELRLDYVGTGNLMPAVRQFIKVFDLANKVNLYGGQSHQKVLTLMKEADIFIQHSVADPDSGDEEGLPVGILEAMAANLPILSTKHAGIPEAVSDQVNGFLVDEGDCCHMAEKLIILAQNRGLRLQMGLESWKKAQQQFTWEKEKRSLLEFMKLN